jgi:hypothetical protein
VGDTHQHNEVDCGAISQNCKMAVSQGNKTKENKNKTKQHKKTAGYALMHVRTELYTLHVEQKKERKEKMKQSIDE